MRSHSQKSPPWASPTHHGHPPTKFYIVMEQLQAPLGGPSRRKSRLSLKGPGSRDKEAGFSGADSVSSLALNVSESAASISKSIFPQDP